MSVDPKQTMWTDEEDNALMYFCSDIDARYPRLREDKFWEKVLEKMYDAFYGDENVTMKTISEYRDRFVELNIVEEEVSEEEEEEEEEYLPSEEDDKYPADYYDEGYSTEEQ